MFEPVIIALIVGLSGAVIFVSTKLYGKRNLNMAFDAAIEELAAKSREPIELSYENKYHYYVQLCQFSRNGKITVPSWTNLGDTEAERARSLLTARENNVQLRIEETGEVISPNPQIPVYN
jgi:hypothetical protein